MRIDGEWYACQDDVVRPIIRGEILNSRGGWEQVPFLDDTGADCTVISAPVLKALGSPTTTRHERLGGVAVPSTAFESRHKSACRATMVGLPPFEVNSQA